MNHCCIRCYLVVIFLLILAITATAAPQASIISTTPSRLTAQLQALYRKEQKLQKIVTRAQNSQRQLAAKRTQARDPSSRASLERWHDIEVRAKALIKKLKTTIAVMEKRRANIAPALLAPTLPRPMGPHIALTHLDGKRELINKHRGTVVLLHFWATWCRPCVKEMPVLELMRSRFQDQNFAILAVSLDARKKDVTRFLRRKGFKLPVYLDPGRQVYQQITGRDSAVLPQTLLIDQTGRIVRSYAGAYHLASPVTFADIRQLLTN